MTSAGSRAPCGPSASRVNVRLGLTATMSAADPVLRQNLAYSGSPLVNYLAARLASFAHRHLQNKYVCSHVTEWLDVTSGDSLTSLLRVRECTFRIYRATVSGAQKNENVCFYMTSRTAEARPGRKEKAMIRTVCNIGSSFELVRMMHPLPLICHRIAR